MADDPTVCDFCGWPGAVLQDATYTCEVCGQSWSIQEDDGEDTDDASA